ncbi:hypothetical protein DFQ02_10998 [Seonamhaeicola aphaedonensis]|uniref:Uncharacterized protein n=1 Tax=Seonamhaeicola aphaedonensis TaxID=1461338 RepID=A0A3D9H747_9FLAO|nr:hypothetical protein DFQ02_10998 [Seonamhaeicola aphaedonensis]
MNPRCSNIYIEYVGNERFKVTAVLSATKKVIRIKG